MTLTDEQLPERDNSKSAEQQGLFRKFDVRRVDESDQPGGKHHGCEYFVLDVQHDAHAKAALTAYAEACRKTHPDLSDDMVRRYGLSAQPESKPAMPTHQWCPDCDGCGWVEGGKTMGSICKKCSGSGRVPL